MRQYGQGERLGKRPAQLAELGEGAAHLVNILHRPGVEMGVVTARNDAGVMGAPSWRGRAKASGYPDGLHLSTCVSTWNHLLRHRRPVRLAPLPARGPQGAAARQALPAD